MHRQMHNAVSSILLVAKYLAEARQVQFFNARTKVIVETEGSPSTMEVVYPCVDD